ncbi:MAG: biotin--[acetyl-CoA-carboxylase] ligase [Thermotoga sp.]|nr:MAG: biotin--[acetyl-CoA-carboxylase] ligase [Thermotoga sp.]
MKMNDWNIIHIDEMNSTMDYVRTHLSELPNRSIVWADIQHRGRGRGKNTWLSPTGGLWFSTLFKNKGVSDAWHITMAFSVAVVSTLKMHSVDAWIKWPNDVYVKNKKIAGILVENVIKGNQISQIVGIGLNVNNDIDETLEDKATSLLQQTGERHSIKSMLTMIMNEYDSIDSKTLYERWSQFSFRLLCTDVKLIDVKGKIHKGKVMNLFENGSIELKEESGEEIFKAGSLIL